MSEIELAFRWLVMAGILGIVGQIIISFMSHYSHNSIFSKAIDSIIALKTQQNLSEVEINGKE